MPMDYEKRDTGRIPESVGTPLDMVFVQTLAGPDAEPYPAEEDEPTTYYCGIMKGVTFDKEVGSPTLQGELTSRRDYVYNLCSGSYIEEDSIVAAFVKNGRLWTMDKVVQTKMLIVAHTLMTTSQGTGSLSRLNPNTGAVIWTVDAGTYTRGGTDYPNLFVSCALDSRGNVYAYWINAATVDGATQGALNSGLPQGVVKFDMEGNELASLDLPTMGVHSSWGSSIFLHPRIRIDQADDTRIYCGSAYDTDGKWLYRLNDALATTWAIGEAESFAVTTPSAGANLSTHGLVISSTGDVYLTNANVTHRCSEAGVLSSSFDAVATNKLFIVPETDELRAATSNTPYIHRTYGNFPTVAAMHAYNEWATPEVGGTWAASFLQRTTAGWSDGLVDVYLAYADNSWTTAGGDTKFARVFATRPNGSILYASEGGSISGVDVAHDTASGKVYVAGNHVGADPVTGVVSTGVIACVSANETEFTNVWVRNIKATGTGSGTGFDVAARTVRP